MWPLRRRPSRPFALASLRALRWTCAVATAGSPRSRKSGGCPSRSRSAAGAVGSREHKRPRRPMRGRFPRRNTVTNHEQNHGTGRNRWTNRWTNRWKAALNAFEITFDGRLFAGRK